MTASDALDPASDPADGRPRGRDSLFLLAQLRVAGAAAPIPVRVRNLSAGGLMAELPGPIDADARIEVEVRGIGWVPGRIAWCTEGRAGIAFDRDIDPQAARKPVGKVAKEAAAKQRPFTFRA